MTSFELSKRLIIKQSKHLLIYAVITILIAMSLEDQMRMLTPELENQRWMIQLGMGLWDFITGVYLILLLSWGLPEVAEWTSSRLVRPPFEESYLPSFFAEYFRTLAQILLWALLFLIPGFVRYARLIFVPFVALFSKEYRAGQVDALELARQLSVGRFGKILAVLIVTSILELIFQLGPNLHASLHNYPVRLTSQILSLYVGIWTFSYLFQLFHAALVSQDTMPLKK